MLINKIKITTRDNKTLLLHDWWKHRSNKDRIAVEISKAIKSIIEERVGLIDEPTIRDDIVENKHNINPIQELVFGMSGKRNPALIRIITANNNNINFGIMYWFQEQDAANSSKIGFFRKMLNVFKS